MAIDDPGGSSPAKSSTEDSLAYYKTQYEQLEAELADFQASSKELEAELERDVDAAEKRERDLRQKVETLTYEVDELKTKYKQSKQEASNAQNALQKEITTLRESSRSLQARLRDIEVSNDDMERQARNTSSSLEDLESKYNHAIERGVLAEEEIKAGEQEREALRIEAQRLRDELSDLRVEAELRQQRLQKAEALVEPQHTSLKDRSPTGSSFPRPQSALSELSPTTSASSPTLATPATKSASSTISESQTPPSPPTSETSNPVVQQTPAPAVTKSNGRLGGSVVKSRPHAHESQNTTRPLPPSARPSRYSRGPSVSATVDRTSAHASSRPSAAPQRTGMVKSGSLYHLKGLMNKTQTLTQRVHTLQSKLPDSKLPAPTATPPRGSPRSGSALGQSTIPSTITVRSSKKRSGGSNVTGSHTPAERPASRLSSAFSHGADRPSSRLSTGIPHASSATDRELVRPTSRDAQHARPGSRAGQSRLSMNHVSSGSVSSTSRPGSRQSMSGSRTPLGHYPATCQTEPRRPRSSLGRTYGNGDVSHSHSSSVNRLSGYGNHLHQTDEEETDEVVTPTPSRRSTFNKDTVSGIPSLSNTKSKLVQPGSSRRTSTGAGEMGPPERKPPRKLSEVGETF